LADMRSKAATIELIIGCKYSFGWSSLSRNSNSACLAWSTAYLNPQKFTTTKDKATAQVSLYMFKSLEISSRPLIWTHRCLPSPRKRPLSR
jgi:hypothetical protein